MSFKRTVSVEIEPTTEEVAKIIWDMSAREQCLLLSKLNDLAFEIVINGAMQFQALRDEVDVAGIDVSTSARHFIQYIFDYFKDQPMTTSEFIEKVEDGESYRINFEKREVRLNGFLVDIDFELLDNVEERLLELFINYKYSVPSAKADSKYFFAFDESHLSTKQLAENEHRYIARAKLEIYVLGLIINNKWDFGDKWYWH